MAMTITSTIRSSMFSAGIGGAVMYLLDPAGGARRRALMRDRIASAASKTGKAYQAVRRDVTNRVGGIAAKARGRFGDGTPDDGVLEARVRAVLGHVSSRPRAIRVTADDGSITLTGQAEKPEVRAIEAATRNVRGVGQVDNRLAVHTSGARPNGWPSW